MSPGLKLLLAGEEEPGDSISIDIPTGSLRHSRHSSIHSRLSTKKENAHIRSPLTNELFQQPSKDFHDDTVTFSTFKIIAKNENSQGQPESTIADSVPLDEGDAKQKITKRESFLKRLFSRKRISSSEPQSPPPAQKKKHCAKESSDLKTSPKQNTSTSSLKERIEFHQTALSVGVFDDETSLPIISEEAQKANVAMMDSTLQTTTVEINSTSESVANCQAKVDDYSQTADVKTVAETVAENVVNQAILAVENDINKSVEVDDKKSQPQSKASTKAPKVKKKKNKEKQPSDVAVEKAVITCNRASTSDSAPFVETVKVEFKKVNQEDTIISKSSSSDLDYDASSSENDTDGDKPMEIEEFQEFGEDIDKIQEQREAEFNHIYHEKQNANESLSGAHLTSILDTPNTPLMDSTTFNQPDNGIPSTVVRAIHRDLQVLSESIDKDLDKLLNEVQEKEDDLLKADKNISSSVSNIAMEKLKEAQIVSHVPLLKSTPEVTSKLMAVQTENTATFTSKETANLIRPLSSNLDENDDVHSTGGATALDPTSRGSTNLVKRLSGNFTETIADKNIVKSPSIEGKALKKSSSIQERLKFFGEKIPEVNKPIIVLQSDNVKKNSQQENAKQPEKSKSEESDIVTPLKIINSTSLRRGSLPNVDKLKMDGLKGEMQEPSPVEANKQKWRMSPLELSNKLDSPVTGRRFMDLGSSHKTALKKHDPESLELYMNSANLDHLTKLHTRTLDDAKMLAIKRADALLEDPVLSGRTAPDAFKEILSQGNSKFIWCVKDTWYSWLEPMDEFPLKLESEECYILLHVSQ